MSILISVLYTILTGLACARIGLGDWLGWALLAMAVVQALGTLWMAITGDN